jgi:hypothetical protein
MNAEMMKKMEIKRASRKVLTEAEREARKELNEQLYDLLIEQCDLERRLRNNLIVRAYLLENSK